MIRIKQLYPSGETIGGIPDPIRRNVVEIPHGIAAHPQLASKNTYHDESFGSRRSLATAIQRIPCVIEEHGKEGSGPTDPFFYLLEFQWQRTIRRDHAGGHDPKRSSTSWSEQSDEEEDPNEGGSTERKKERLERVHVGRSCRVVGQGRRPKNHCSRWNQQKANIGSSSTRMQREGSAGMDHRQRRAQRHECVRGP